MDEKIEKFSSSDYHTTTMHATNTFDRLLQEIRSSNLNFQLQESPFSAQISIKKSLVKEKNGSLRHPPVISCKDAKIKALETRANYLEKGLESIRTDYVKANKKIKELEDIIIIHKQIKSEPAQGVFEDLVNSPSGL